MSNDRYYKIKIWCNLYKAAQEGDLKEVQRLLIKGVDISYEHPDFVNSPLIAAAQNGYIGVVKALIEAGADPLYQSKVSLKTAADYAKERGYLQVFNYLKAINHQQDNYDTLLTAYSLN